jgi:hypothetical protein
MIYSNLNSYKKNIQRMSYLRNNKDSYPALSFIITEITSRWICQLQWGSDRFHHLLVRYTHSLSGLEVIIKIDLLCLDNLGCKQVCCPQIEYWILRKTRAAFEKYSTLQYVKLIRYQFWCTRCAFRLIKSPQWCSGRKSWKSRGNVRL